MASPDRATRAVARVYKPLSAPRHTAAVHTKRSKKLFSNPAISLLKSRCSAGFSGQIVPIDQG